MSQATIETRVRQYVQLRDKIKDLDDQHKERMRPYRDALEQLNGVLLANLNAVGADNIRTPAGTAYRKERKSATIADGQVFMDHVIRTQAWDLLDRRVNVTAVADRIDAGQELPPGINFSKSFDVGVRRA